ncbi:MAG: hypothetical protein KGN84_14705 [Acidobacteriota bacterium]|nr:hypothetical protein [Acidobacteriota bacterium]
MSVCRMIDPVSEEVWAAAPGHFDFLRTAVADGPRRTKTTSTTTTR